MNKVQDWPIEEQVARAAKWRVEGISWARIAHRVRKPRADVEKWPEEFADIWRRAEDRATYDAEQEVTAELLLTVRNLMRSEEEKTRLTVVDLMFQLHIENVRAASKSREYDSGFAGL